MVVTYVFLLEEAMYSYCLANLTEVFLCFFFSCKANVRV